MSEYAPGDQVLTDIQPLTVFVQVSLPQALDEPEPLPEVVDTPLVFVTVVYFSDQFDEPPFDSVADEPGVVSFLGGPDGGWVNGQVLRANGGFA